MVHGLVKERGNTATPAAMQSSIANIMSMKVSLIRIPVSVRVNA